MPRKVKSKSNASVQKQENVTRDKRLHARKAAGEERNGVSASGAVEAVPKVGIAAR
jgi:hypothetical protein